MTKLSMTPGAIRSRAYRVRKKLPAPSVRARRPYRLSQRLRDAKRATENLTFTERQIIIDAINGNAQLQALTAKGHSPWNDTDHHHASDDGMPEQPALDLSGHDAGTPTDAAPFRPAEAEDFEHPFDAIRAGLTSGPELIYAEAGETAPPGRSYSEVVAEMRRQRMAPRGFQAAEPPPPNPAPGHAPPRYSVKTRDRAKFRELIAEEGVKDRLCVAESMRILTNGILEAARIMAAPATTRPQERFIETMIDTLKMTGYDVSRKA